MSINPPRANASIAPTGPPRDNQSSIKTTHPTPTMLPKEKVKYSTVVSVRCSFATEGTIARGEGK